MEKQNGVVKKTSHEIKIDAWFTEGLISGMDVYYARGFLQGLRAMAKNLNEMDDKGFSVEHETDRASEEFLKAFVLLRKRNK